jgi:hypothetical protein
MRHAIAYNGERCDVSMTEVIPGTNGTLALQLVSKAHRRRWLWPRLTTLRGPSRTSVRGRDLLHQGRRSVAVITPGTVGCEARACHRLGQGHMCPVLEAR